MKKLLLILSLTVISQLKVVSQGCLPNGVTFSSQTEIDSFQNNYPDCTQIEGHVFIEGDSISNLNGLNVLSKIEGDLTISYTNLNNLSGLNMLDTVNGILHIQHNNSLFTLNDLEHLTYVGGHFIIAHCNALSDFSGLENLSTIGEDLFITFNLGLKEINGLIGLNAINGNFWIDGNDNLTSLEGLNNVDPFSINDVLIRSNSVLSKCNVQSICDYLTNPLGLIAIYDNSTGCNDKDEILDSCATVGIAKLINDSKYMVYPNPASSYFSISTINGEIINEIIIYDLLGKKVLHKKEITEKIDISNLEKGIYILELFADKLEIRKKLIIK